MIVSVVNPVFQTWIFSALIFLAIFLSLRSKKNSLSFSPEVSASLKGFAILAVVLSHVGYFLVLDHKFLYPLSTFAGVGVNLFLFLSGYGLTMSSLKKQKSLLATYYYRLSKLMLPLWIVLILLFGADYLFLHHSFSWGYIAQSFLGFFPTADLYADINSPLWYITLTLFYYFILPLVFLKKRPWISAVIIYVISFLIVRENFPILSSITRMYKIHLLAFPLGMIVANFFMKADYWNAIYQKVSLRLRYPIYYFFIILFFTLAYYFSVNAYIGEGKKEEWASVAVVLAVSALFILFQKESRFLQLLGNYSYEIYLLHWPLLYHYDFLFKFLPAGLAMALYIPFLLGLSYLLRQIVVGLTKIKEKLVSVF